MTAIVDYGVGNLFSLISSLRYLKQDAVLTSEEGSLLAKYTFCGDLVTVTSVR